MGGKDGPLGIIQEIKILPKYQIVYKLESILKNEMHKILWDFEIQTDHLILGRKPGLVLINKIMKYAGHGNTWNSPQRIRKGIGTFGNQRKNRDHLD